MSPTEPHRGAFLYSLEPELYPSEELVSEAILIAALFSSSICLSEHQVFVTEGVRAFFHKNEPTLTEILENPEETPFITISLRRQADVWATLDLRLKPKGEKGYPSYDNSLTPIQNDQLRADYRNLKTAVRRRRKFLKLSGDLTQAHLSCIQSYISRNPLKTTTGVSTIDPPGLYDSTRAEIVQLLSSTNAIVEDSDKKIADAVINRMDKHPKSEAQTREMLHWSVYGGESPPVYQGRVQWAHSPITIDPVKDEWRFLLNSIYNYNLAQKLNLRPVLNSDWWQIGTRWLSQSTLRRRLNLQQAGTLPLSTPLYRDHITVNFVRSVRKEKEFWVSLNKVEESRNRGDATALEKTGSAHVQLISELLAKHLIDTGHKDLVRRDVKEVFVQSAQIGGFLAGPVVTLMGCILGVPLESAFEIGVGALAAGEAIHFAVKGLFTVSPITVTSSSFKSLRAEIATAGLG